MYRLWLPFWRLRFIVQMAFTLRVLQSRKFVGYTDNAVIFADIVGRGVNFGAYVGEAAILEQIEVLKQHFSIDENKVYLSGSAVR